MVRAGATRRSAVRSGFTLLELVVALALGSVVMVMAVSALRLAVRSAGSAAVEMERGSREGRVYSLLAAQAAWAEVSEDGQAALFRGDPGGIDLGTLAPASAPHTRRPATARWRVARMAGEDERYALVYEEAATRGSAEIQAGGAVEPGQTPAESLRGGVDLANARRLLEGYSRIEFAFYSNDAGGAGWRELWSGPGLPRAMRVTLVTPEGEERRWVVPVAVTF